MDTRHAHPYPLDVHPYSTSPLRPLGLSYPPGPPPGSLSAGRAAAAEPAFPSYASSAAAPPPSRLLCLIPLTPRVAIPCPTPRARAAALGYIASPPRGAGVRTGSPWSTNRARTRGLSIVLGSPLPSAGSSSSSGRRGPPCRRSRWSGLPPRRRGLPPARAGFWKDDQGHRGFSRSSS